MYNDKQLRVWYWAMIQCWGEDWCLEPELILGRELDMSIFASQIDPLEMDKGVGLISVYVQANQPTAIYYKYDEKDDSCQVEGLVAAYSEEQAGHLVAMEVSEVMHPTVVYD